MPLLWPRERCRRALLLGLRRRPHRAAGGAPRAQGANGSLCRPGRLHRPRRAARPGRGGRPTSLVPRARTRRVERFGGTVEKFIGDAVVALFGAPVTHEDDAERAVRAALAIRDWAREEDKLEVRVAVNTGEALVTLDARPSGAKESRRATCSTRPLDYSRPHPSTACSSASRRTARRSASSSTRTTSRSRRRGRSSRWRSGRPSRPAPASASMCPRKAAHRSSAVGVSWS